MKKIPTLLIILLLSAIGLHAQPSVEHYKFLESSGPFPTDFTEILQQQSKNHDLNGFLRAMIKDGKVLYGTPLNNYVNTVADNLLKDYPELRSQLRFYILKSPVVNAYSTENGTILVNIGLLAQISNEGELAFVLAHEISHYSERHFIKDDINDKLSEANFIYYYLRYHNRSREQEFSADRVGIERYFSHSNYSYSVLDGAFDVLLYSDLPFNEIAFPLNLVETSFYDFPNNYTLPAISPIANRAEVTDTLSTHPNIEKRRAAIQLQIAGISDAGRKTFIQSEDLFYEIRNLARLECLNQWLISHEYDKVVYNSFVMRQILPDNAFVDKAFVTGFYGLARHKNYGQAKDALTPYKEVTGEMQQVSYFLSKLTKPESSLLALRQAWNAHLKYPDDPYYMDLIKDNIHDVFVKNKMKYTDFSDYPMGFDLGSLEKTEGKTHDTASYNDKYSRIKQQYNQVEKIRPNEKFKTANYMLVDLHRDSAFVALMNVAILNAENEKILHSIATPQAAKIDKLLVLEPVCSITPANYDFKGRQQAMKKGERLSQRLTKNIIRGSKKLKLTPVFYDDKTMSRFDTKQYNDYARLQEWIREYKYAGCMEMRYQHTGEIARIASELHCQNLCFVVTDRNPYNFISYYKIQGLALSVFCPYSIPFAVLCLATPQYSTHINVVISDFTNGKQIVVGNEVFTSPMSEAYINAFVYNELYDFVKGKKSKR